MRKLVSEALHRLRTELQRSEISGHGYISALSYGKATFNKTRYHSHVAFLRTCLEKKAIPTGFQLSFNAGNLQNGADYVLRSSSFKLMRRALRGFSKCMDKENTLRITHRGDLQEDPQDFRTVSTLVHHINSDLYTELADGKRRKMDHLSPTLTVDATDILREVVCIPEDIELDEHERKVLSKGLNFVPTQDNDELKQQSELNHYLRKVKLRGHFGNKEERQEDGLFAKFAKKKNKNWTPKSGEYDAIDNYVKRCQEDFKKLPPRRKQRQKNITREEEDALRRLKRRDDIVIKPADKGGAVCVWRKDKYLEEGFRQLSDGHFYEECPEDITADNQKKIKQAVRRLVKAGKLEKAVENTFMVSPKVSAFYLLPKIHKEGIPGRPVVSNIGCPTYDISKFLSGYLRPLVEKLPTYLQDTNHLMRIVADFDFSGDDEPLLFTMDIKSLYTNIPHEGGLNAIKYYLEHHDEGGADPTAILRLAELVLSKNCFQFAGKFYLQKVGCMMGSSFSVEFACLYVAYNELLIRRAYTGRIPELLKRYIDDIFGATTMSREDLLKFIEFVDNFNPALRYTFQVGSSVEMLDARLSIEERAIDSTIYYKPTASHSYLNWNSDHPPKCARSIPKSQFIRVKMICRKPRVFREESERMVGFFKKRDYPENIIREALTQVNTMDRATLIREKQKEQKTTRITMPLTYSKHSTAVARIVHRHYHLLQEDPDLQDLFDEPPLIAYRKGRSLRDELVHSRERDQTVGTYRCSRTGCVTCAHTNPDPFIVGPSGYVNVSRKFTCESKFVVYVISCKRCGGIYVGETGERLGDRFQSHRWDVTRYATIPIERHTVVSDHFNDGDHNVDDMLVSAVYHRKNKQDLRFTEQKLIAHLGAYRGEGMNIDFRFLHNIQDR